MDMSVHKLPHTDFPPLLSEIPQPPKELWYVGTLPNPSLTLLTVVGSRKFTDYGKHVVDYLIDGLRGYPIGIVSGLALGMDALAHSAALKNNLYTLSVPGSGLDPSVLYPRTNRRLAREIVEHGGGLLSEYEPLTPAAPWTFPQRNRIMAGISHATLVIEATEKSGSLITARLTAEYNRELLVVPGSIFSTHTSGPHQFLKLGATPVTTPQDILEALHIDERTTPNEAPLSAQDLSKEESLIIELLREPMERDLLIRESGLPAERANVLLMEMELKGLITSDHSTIYPRPQ